MLSGRIYAVTGGSGALGAAVVRALAERGAEVRVFDRAAPAPAFLPSGADAARVTSEVVDLTDERAVTAVYARCARLDGSIHCAGGFDMKPLTQTTLSEFEAMWRMNTVSCFLACREAVRAIARNRSGGGSNHDGTLGVRGWIVNVAARPAVSPVAGMCAYATSKAAVANLTQSLAAELIGDGILVNAVLPSIMNTPANRAAMPNADHGKWPRVEDVAAVIRALASPANALTSGALVPVYGAA